MIIALKDPNLTDGCAFALAVDGKPFVTLRWDGSVIISPEYQRRMTETARLFWQSIEAQAPTSGAAEPAHKQLADQHDRFDLILKGAYALNQEAHCYDHQPAVFELLSEQTTLLRTAMESLDLKRAIPASPVQGCMSSTVNWHAATETLPEDSETVLVACENGEVGEAFHLAESTGWTWSTGHLITTKVIAWSALPPPPSMEGIRP